MTLLSVIYDTKAISFQWNIDMPFDEHIQYWLTIATKNVINKCNCVQLKTGVDFSEECVTLSINVEFRSFIVNILEYLSDMLKCVEHFHFSRNERKRKLNVRKKYFSIFIQFISQDICANALFVSNIGIITLLISYCCKISFYSVLVSFLFSPCKNNFFCKYRMFQIIYKM